MTKEFIALILSTVVTAIGIYNIPSWNGFLTDICLQASFAACVTIAILYITRLFGKKGIKIEINLMMYFLAAMPIVYIISFLTTNGLNINGWFLLEVIGLIIYTTLALLGVKHSLWFIVIGIAAHGLVWDAWHWFLNSIYIPNWYSIGCLLIDVGLSFYLIIRMQSWLAYHKDNLGQS
jgi:hypothetical protein